MEGYAPGWQLRCPKCGGIQDASESGLVRVGAASKGKRLYLRCGLCNKRAFLHLERTPDEPASE